MIDAITSLLQQLHFYYAEQFFVALPPMAVTVYLHATGMNAGARFFRKYGSTRERTKHRLLVTTVVVAIMLMAHFCEVSVWAVYYTLTGMITDFKTSMYFSVNAYTTLGASNLSLPGRWQGLDGLEAMTAMLMFGWSTALLASVVQKLHSLDT